MRVADWSRSRTIASGSAKNLRRWVPHFRVAQRFCSPALDLLQGIDTLYAEAPEPLRRQLNQAIFKKALSGRSGRHGRRARTTIQRPHLTTEAKPSTSEGVGAPDRLKKAKALRRALV